MFGNELEKLLEDMFKDDESDLENIIVLGDCIRPLETLGNCCTHNYASYSG